MNPGGTDGELGKEKFTFELTADMGSAIKQLSSRTHPQLKIKVCHCFILFLLGVISEHVMVFFVGYSSLN